MTVRSTRPDLKGIDMWGRMKQRVRILNLKWFIFSQTMKLTSTAYNCGKIKREFGGERERIIHISSLKLLKNI